jgi:inner membrane transporter RhtA
VTSGVRSATPGAERDRRPRRSERAIRGAGRLPPELLFAASAISQYLGATLAVLLFTRVPAAGVAMLRVTCAAVVLLSWRRPSLRRAPREWILIAGFGVALAFMNLTFYESIARIPVGTAVAIEFVGPVTVAALGLRRRRDWIALLIATAGVVLAADVQIAHNGLGVAFALLAAVFWGLYIVLGQRVAVTVVNGIDALAQAMVIGGLAIAPLAVVPAAKAFGAPLLLAAVVGVGLLSSVLPYGLDQFILRRMPRHRYALTLALLPATAVVVGSVVLGQVPSLAELAGIVLVMASLAVGQSSAAARPPRGGPAQI